MIRKLVELGFTDDKAAEVYAQGVTELEDLYLMDDNMEKDILSMGSMYGLSARAKSRFRAFRQWAVEQYEKDTHANAWDFSLDVCKDFMAKMRMRKSQDNRDGGTTVMVAQPSAEVTSQAPKNIKIPSVFDGKEKNWKDWKNKFETYLGTLRGESNVPLIYVI